MMQLFPTNISNNSEGMVELMVDELKPRLVKYYGPNNDMIDWCTFFIVYNLITNSNSVITNKFLEDLKYYNERAKKKNLLLHLKIMEMVLSIVRRTNYLLHLRGMYL